MSGRVRALLACAALAAAAAPLRAGESLYVVEQLVVSLNSTADGSGERITTLKSGDRVELIERAGEAVHVRLPDGREGWLRALYVSGDEPMRPRLAQSEAEVSRLRAEVSRLSAQLAAQPAPPAAAADEPAAPAAAPLFAPMPAAESHRAGLWVGLGALGGLALGFALGWRTLDRTIRRKYGGLKIY